MQIERSRPRTDLSVTLAEKLRTLYGPCVGCADCHGLCPALIETLMLPDAVLKPKEPAADEPD